MKKLKNMLDEAVIDPPIKQPIGKRVDIEIALKHLEQAMYIFKNKTFLEKQQKQHFKMLQSLIIILKTILKAKK